MGGSKSWPLVAVAALPLLVIGSVVSFLLLGTSAEATSCHPLGGESVTIDPEDVPDKTIAGYEHEQLVNAAYILQAGKALGLGSRDQTIGVMTAMGESSLRVLDHGDDVGPDSRGLFQQRDNGAWGSLEDRMDPFTSATNFFKVLATIEGRDTMEPTIAAHKVQRNADPYHYTKYWEPAIEVVEGLTGIDLDLSVGAECVTVPGEVNDDGWAAPSAGPVTSKYGMREHPIHKVWRLHAGTDLNGGGCEGPIWAARDGEVTFADFDGAGNGTIRVAHEAGVETSYLHMYRPGILVKKGDKVLAGQQIGRVGSSGVSTACHLHYGVKVDGEFVDPEPFMAAVGITLGH